MWELIKETEKKRVYRSNVTSTEVTTSLIYTDQGGDKWWAFDDLMQIPYHRKLASNTLSQLYGVGFTKKDLDFFVKDFKEILKSSEPDKYERAFAQILTLEKLAEENLNPMKQELGLCSVYILSDDERIDVYDGAQAAEKVDRWAMDMEAVSFFLTWLTDGMLRYTKLLSETSETALKVVDLKKKLESLGK